MKKSPDIRPDFKLCRPDPSFPSDGPQLKRPSYTRMAVYYVMFYGIFIPLVSPILLVAGINSFIEQKRRDREHDKDPQTILCRERRRKEERREKLFRKRRVAHKPRSLPKRRLRSLSLLQEGRGSLLSKFKPKTLKDTVVKPSFLLAKLPPDVRTQIWEYVLGGYAISLYRGPGRLYHLLHDDEDDDDDLKEQEQDLKQPDFSRKVGKTNLLALAKVCRQVYIEAISILYTKNTFLLYQNDTLFDLKNTTLPFRFSSIRSLKLHWQFRNQETFERDISGTLSRHVSTPWDVQTWKSACTILSQLPALENLSVNIQGPFLFSQNVDDMLEELRVVNNVKGEFRVKAPWSRIVHLARDDGMDWRLEHKGFPFRVRRPEVVFPDLDEGVWLFGEDALGPSGEEPYSYSRDLEGYLYML
ncbi:hypothetical protein G7Y89_g5629 [Cudoniella acicularis]|uniref:DUF7730 domain-containing protein n=1 Tax=Cudoniella acicularis TaxID=354080 RepID=A0A8H4W3M3_9HELO|nr:hypothetical protein G7Y89_g5629 [Cudoniella acicularis]